MLATGDHQQVGIVDEHANLHAIWTLDCALMSERLLIISLAIISISPRIMCRMYKRAERTLVKEDTLCYLKANKVHFQTCVRVLFYLDETHHVQNMQQNFNSMMKNTLPCELKQTVREELWSRHLLSLGIILHVSHWHHDFLSELCRVVEMETQPERTVLCKHGDAAISAFYILKGVLSRFDKDGCVPDLTEGMWHGEKSLVNTSQRRKGTVVTRCLCQIMVLPTSKFHETLARYHLVPTFERFCSEHIWKGICGRCGSIGDHFAEDCPHIQAKSHKHGISRLIEKAEASISKSNLLRHHSTTSVIDTSNGSPLLRHFLTHHDFEHLETHLNQADIKDFEALLEVAKNYHIIDLLPSEVSGALSISQREALSLQKIDEFYTNANDVIASNLFTTQGMKHFVFVSHYKLNAGTEAALIRQELEGIYSVDAGCPANLYDVPVFLDSENLDDLEDLQDHVKRSHNLVLLLTDGVLTRPWVLVELVTAVKERVRILPMQVFRPGVSFQFPTNDFIEELMQGKHLDEDGRRIMQTVGIELAELGPVLHHVFHKIAVPYSPHGSTVVRNAQLSSLHKLCHLRSRVKDERKKRRKKLKNQASLIQQRSLACEGAASSELVFDKPWIRQSMCL